ncbi:MAG: 30S ribosomal protein S1 [Cytophagales bacterium]|nr:30S ribosomal protein S1 [Cytophagales bacterium]
MGSQENISPSSESPESSGLGSSDASSPLPDPSSGSGSSLPEDGDFLEDYSPAERAQMEGLYAKNLKLIEEDQILTGTVTHMTGSDVVIDVGYKSDGLVHLSEFRGMENPVKVGDSVDVFVEHREDAQGNLVLSRKKALVIKSWEEVARAMEEERAVEGQVKRRTKGGLILDLFGIEAFLPGSQIDVKPVKDFDAFVGKNIEVKVLKINYQNENIVVSHRALIEKDIEAQKSEILDNLEQGQVLEGVVKNITRFGAFIDLGGIDGLLHITDISWKRIQSPEDVFRVEDKINVVVLSFDKERKRISLGMKQLEAHPWDQIGGVNVGDKVKGRISNITDYGAFLEIFPAVEGLIHVSEMSWSQHLKNPSDFVKLGQEIEACVLSIDRDEHKIGLGIKQLTPDPWENKAILKKYGIGTTHTGVVRNLTHYGLFLELEEGIDGLVHISDLSWTKRIHHPSDLFKVGDEVEIIVMEIDSENKRLSLSHKHLQEDPWDTLESIFTPDSLHRSTLIHLDDRSGVVELPYGVEGACSIKHLYKKDKTLPKVGDTLDVKILKIQGTDRRIVYVSHLHTHQEKGSKSEGETKAASLVKNYQKTEKRKTMGDLQALSDLQKTLKEEEKEKKTSKASEKVSPKAKTQKKTSSGKDAEKPSSPTQKG